MSEGDVRVFASPEELSAAAAAEIAAALRRAAEAGRATIALSGGGTPRGLHRRLAESHSDLPWERVHVFWGDERYVPRDAPDSNYRMARETLLEHIAIPPDNVHPMPTGASDPDEAARAYEEELRSVFGDTPAFDVILLGMGDDGHTASLFPGSPALEETARWVVPAEAPAEPRRRLTLTPPVLCAAEAIHFLVAGASKRAALACALSPDGPAPTCPASLVRPLAGTLTWWVDEAAGGRSTKA